MDPFDRRAVGAAYDEVAEDYLAAFGDDLARLPVDRAVLDASSEGVARDRLVLDVGCGPGQVAQYLEDRGVHVAGVDLARRMLALARRRVRQARLACADMRALPIRSSSCAGAVSFYSVQHVPRGDLGIALGELNRVMAPAGTLVVATHLGEGVFVSDDFLGHRIGAVGGNFYSREELEAALVGQGFRIDRVEERDPLPHEFPSRRIYLLASPAAGSPAARTIS